MQLVMQRFRLRSGIWYRFKINVRLVLTRDEDDLLAQYSLRHVALTEGHMRRDLIRAALISIPIVVILGFIEFAVLLFLRIFAFAPPLLLFLIIFFTTFSLVYLQIREVVMVNDLLVGRDFMARSLIALLYKEDQIRKMSAAFERILEQAKTWHMPEVIDLTPKPILSVLEDENAVA
jgi:hypothetical protein